MRIGDAYWIPASHWERHEINQELLD